MVSSTVICNGVSIVRPLLCHHLEYPRQKRFLVWSQLSLPLSQRTLGNCDNCLAYIWWQREGYSKRLGDSIYPSSKVCFFYVHTSDSHDHFQEPAQAGVGQLLVKPWNQWKMARKVRLWWSLSWVHDTDHLSWESTLPLNKVSCRKALPFSFLRVKIPS